MLRSTPPGPIEDSRVARRDPRAEPESERPERASAPQLVAERREFADDSERKDDRAAGVRRQLAQLQTQLVELQMQLARELQGRAEDGERIEELERALAKRDADLTDSDWQIDALKASVAEGKSAVERVEADASARRIELVAKTAEIESLSAKLAEEHDKRGAAEADAIKWITTCKQRDEQLKGKSREIDSMYESNIQLELEVGSAKEARDKAQARAQTAVDRTAELERHLAARDAEVASLRTELASARQVLEAETARGESRLKDLTDLEQCLRHVLRAEDEVVSARRAAAAWLERGQQAAPVGASGPATRPAPPLRMPSAYPSDSPSLDVSVVEVDPFDDSPPPAEHR
jgi:chromosome segregation ATPase